MTRANRFPPLAPLAVVVPAQTCPECNDTGMRDTGGVYPWGEGIFEPCDHHSLSALAVMRDAEQTEELMAALRRIAEGGE